METTIDANIKQCRTIRQTSELRFLSISRGVNILQQKWIDINTGETEWINVPIIKE